MCVIIFIDTMELTNQQKQALSEVLNFLDNKDKSIFILRGYAGTGKTTLIKSIITRLDPLGKNFTLLAPTGRAAKILQEKTGYNAYTIHSCIYSFNKMQVVRHDDNGELIITNHTKDTEIRSNGSDDIQFWFNIKGHYPDKDPSSFVYIIDESSMISSRKVKNEKLHFGTDILIDDLLTYARLNLGAKVIFVGDPAQLPPVGDNRSAALEESFFNNLKLGVSSFELTEVIRQEDESAILKNAIQIRQLLESGIRNKLCLERKSGEVEDATPEQVIDIFYKNNPEPYIGNSIIICYTNNLVKEYNDALRRLYFPNCPYVRCGDILQVVKNNINETLGIKLFNGDFVTVVEVSDSIETQSAPVWTDLAGKRQRVTYSFDFRDVVIETEYGEKIKCKIIDSLLRSDNTSLSVYETVALYINFRMRHPDLKQNEEAFNDAINRDPYFNAINVKYGYAITGHKSQGGEWETVFADYTKRRGLNDEMLRWTYTVTTRATKKLYGVNMPDITPISKLNFSPIVKISKPANDAFSYRDVEVEILKGKDAKAFQKQKCLHVKKQLESVGFFLTEISMLSYLDRYTIETPSGSAIFDCNYNGAGMYTRYLTKSDISEKEHILKILEDESYLMYEVNYTPSCDTFSHLYNTIRSLCDDLDIEITNIVENDSQYNIFYYLKTSGKFSFIQLFFTKNKIFTYALPGSDIGIDDIKLIQIIDKLKKI